MTIYEIRTAFLKFKEVTAITDEAEEVELS